MNGIGVFNAKRDSLFRNLTLEAATAHWNEEELPAPSHPLVPLAAMHKARLQWLDATDETLAESQRWLKENDFGVTFKGGAAPLDPISRDIQRAMHGMPPLMRPPK